MTKSESINYLAELRNISIIKAGQNAQITNGRKQ
jgi:hypothetical protein